MPRSLLRTIFLSIALLSISHQSQSQNLKKYIWETYLGENSQFKENFIQEIAFDDNYGSWIITTGQKLIQWDNRKWKTVEFTNLDKKGLKSITFDPKGRLYIANNSQLVYYNPKSNKTKYIKMPAGTNANKVYCNDEGVLLIGCSLASDSGYLYQFQKGKFTLLEDQYEDVFHINMQQEESILVAFRNGLYKYTMNEDGTYSDSATKVSGMSFYKTVYDRKGNMWAAGFDKAHLFGYNGKKWVEYPRAPISIQYKKANGTSTYAIHDLTVLRDGRIAIATQMGCHIGIYDPETKKWEAYSIPVKHKNDGIQKILWSPRGQIWCGTWKNGVSIFRKPYPKPADFTKEGDKISYIPDPERTVETKQEIKVKSSKILIEFKDSKKFDGDTLSLYLNGNLIVENEALEPEFKTVQIKLKKGKNELVLFAHNLGTIPPNTVDIRIVFGNKSKNIILESDLTTCERLVFVYGKN